MSATDAAGWSVSSDVLTALRVRCAAGAEPRADGEMSAPIRPRRGLRKKEGGQEVDPPLTHSGDAEVPSPAVLVLSLEPLQFGTGAYASGC